MSHNHSRFHMDKAKSNLIALEDHLTSEPCVECMDKHSLSAVSYLEEEVQHNPNANPKLLNLAQKVRNIRRELQEIEGLKHDQNKEKLNHTV